MSAIGLPGRFSFVRSDLSNQLLLKWNARVLRTGSGQNALLVDQNCSVLPLRSVRARDSESCGGKNVRAGL